jgi:hypothetical protein
MNIAIQPQPYLRKKKVLVLVSRGGGGHKTAGDSLKQILGDSYDVEVNPVIADILGSIDTLNRLTQGHFTGEDLYNFLLRHHQSTLLKWMTKYGSRHFTNERIEKAFEKYLQEQSQVPDLIISPTPYINYGIACVADRWDIPFLIIPTDLDGSTFLQGFPEKPTYHRFKMALAYDDPQIKETTFHKAAIRDDQILITGFPVRPSCMKKYSRQELSAIRSSFNLFETHQTITLVMGAVGGTLIFEHVKALTSFEPQAHQLQLQINVCVGHNQKIGNKIRNYLLDRGAKFLGRHTFLLPSGLIIHLRGYMKNLVEIMAASDIIITKTGSCTVNEAIYLGKKLLLDNTHRSTAKYLRWEEFNIPFVQRHSLGYAFSDNQQLQMLIPSLLKYPDKPKQQLELPHFAEKITQVVQQLIGS